jgi:hypothetical protein
MVRFNVYGLGGTYKLVLGFGYSTLKKLILVLISIIKIKIGT